MHSNRGSSVLLFFVDGLGIGQRSEENPLFKIPELAPLAVFQDQTGPEQIEGTLAVTDACLGIEGRPQSASGQTTIYTGINAPARLGYHKQGFPNAELREIIDAHSIFKQLKSEGIEHSVFANTYTPKFFESEPRWKSATTCAVEAAKMRFCRIPDLLGGRALYHDFTNRTLIAAGHKVPEFSPVDAAEILVRLTNEYSFVLYEHFITDKIGHDMDWDRAERHLPELATLIRETISRLNPSRTTFVLTSDHGNIEDLSIRNHTRNPVPTFIWGRDMENFGKRIKDLTDITPAILDNLTS